MGPCVCVASCGCWSHPRPSASLRGGHICRGWWSSHPAHSAAGQRVPVRTEYTGITEHSSSRVLERPGGKDNMSGIFGGASADDRKAALMARRAQVGAFTEATNTLGQ